MIQPYWQSVHQIIEKVTIYSQYLLHHTAIPDKHYWKSLDMVNAVRIRVLTHWKKTLIPSLKEWFNRLELQKLIYTRQNVSSRTEHVGLASNRSPIMLLCPN